MINRAGAGKLDDHIPLIAMRRHIPVISIVSNHEPWVFGGVTMTDSHHSASAPPAQAEQLQSFEPGQVIR